MIYQIVFLLIPLIYFHFYYKKFPEKSYGNFKDDFIEFFGFNIISWNTLKKGLTLAFILIFVFFLIGIIYSSFIASDTQNVNSFIEDSYESLGWLFIILLIVSAFSEELFLDHFLLKDSGYLFHQFYLH
jgi:integral membrane sensor domain MASE1